MFEVAKKTEISAQIYKILGKVKNFFDSCMYSNSVVFKMCEIILMRE